MKKIYLLLTLLILITTDMLSQEIIGKWYGINRSGLIEFYLTDDTLEIRALYSDMRIKDAESDKKHHAGIYKAKDRILVAFPDKKNPNEYRVMTFFNIKEKESVEIAANAIGNVTGQIDELIKLSYADTAKLYGNIIYNEHFIPALKRMKNIEQMTLEDFKLFLKNFIRKKEDYKNFKDNMAGTFTYQLITRTLFEMGFNPINGVDIIDRQFEKFINDPEVKELLKKI